VTRHFEIGRRAALLGAGAALIAGGVRAQEAYPSRPIRMIIPFPAGGPTDVYARLYAERLGRELGQTVVTENRGGAGGALYPLVTRQPQFDVARDFTTIAELGGGPLCWLAHPSRPATLPAFLAAARTANPTLSYGSPGSGTIMHLATELLKQQAGRVTITHVPYRGAAPAMNDLVGGTLALAVNTFGGGLPLHQGGRARMLAVATARRLDAAPDVPTVAEALGLASFETVLWHAVFAPPALPAPILERLSAATNAALADPAFRTSLTASGITASAPGTPASAAAFIAAETARYRPVVEAIRPELEQ